MRGLVLLLWCLLPIACDCAGADQVTGDAGSDAAGGRSGGDGDLAGDGDGDGDLPGDGDGDQPGDGDGAGDGDGDAGAICGQLESAVADALDALSGCNVDADCEAVYSPLCGSSSSHFDGGCHVYKRIDAELTVLDAAFEACVQAACVPGCVVADCDCSPPPPPSCVAGICGPLVEEDLANCRAGDACIVVPYAHCCGSTRRAIRADALDAYNSHPAWQVFDDPATCAVIGKCLDDSAVTDAVCQSGRCQLVYP